MTDDSVLPQGSFTPELQTQMPHVMRVLAYLLNKPYPENVPTSTNMLYAFMTQAANKKNPTARVQSLAPRYYSNRENPTLCDGYEIECRVMSDAGWKLPCTLFATEKEIQFVIGYTPNDSGPSTCHGYFSTLGEATLTDDFFNACCSTPTSGEVLAIVLEAAQQLMQETAKASQEKLAMYTTKLETALAGQKDAIQHLSPAQQAAWNSPAGHA